MSSENGGGIKNRVLNLRIKEEKNEELRRQRKVIIMTNTDE